MRQLERRFALDVAFNYEYYVSKQLCEQVGVGMQTLRKIVRYIALAALIVGLVLIAYGAIVNQVAMNTFFTLLNQGGFKAFLIGILLVVAAIVLVVMSFFVGRGRTTQQKPKPKPAQQQQELAPKQDTTDIQ